MERNGGVKETEQQGGTDAKADKQVSDTAFCDVTAS